VTVHVVRRWEQGQPPKNDRHLTALLAAMGKANAGSLTTAERACFERLCVDAARAHHYPGRAHVWGSELAHMPDVDELAEDQFYKECPGGCAADVVKLTVDVGDLKTVVDLPASAPARGGPKQARRQEVALVYLMGALAHYQACAGRSLLAAQWSAANAAFLQRRFGVKGLGGLLSVAGQRSDQAFNRALAFPESGAEPLLHISRAALAAGEPNVGVTAFFGALQFAHHMDKEKLQSLRGEAQLMLRACEDIGHQQTTEAAHFSLYAASTAQGLWGEAEGHLLQFQRWNDLEGMPHVLWHGTCADLLRQRGDVAEADAHLREGLRLAERHGFLGQSSCFTDSLRTLEQANASRPRR
jgi:hypothetical protein